MRDLPQHNPAHRPLLDSASRHLLVWFACRLAGLVLLTCLPALTGQRTPQDAVSLLSFACGIGAAVCFFHASIRRVPLGRGALNGWDEGMAFLAAARLAHCALWLAS